jgi:hypothetical protein
MRSIRRVGRAARAMHWGEWLNHCRSSRLAPVVALLRLDPCREGAPLERFLSIKLSLYSRFYLYYLKLFNVYLSLVV